jgi:hypothetical protein
MQQEDTYRNNQKFSELGWLTWVTDLQGSFGSEVQAEYQGFIYLFIYFYQSQAYELINVKSKQWFLYL